MEYIKYPIPIEAIMQFDLNEKHFHEELEDILPDWIRDAMGWIIKTDDYGKGAYMHTLEGKMFAEHGKCYIIHGPKGELYPCRADIFEETYEPYEE